MTAEAPPVRGTVPVPEHRPVKGLRRALVVGTAAAGLAIAGLLGYDILQPKGQTPQPTPISGGIGEPTPSATPEITIAPTPEATQTPAPTPTPTPEATPTPEPTQNLAELEQRLQDWVNGKIKVPESVVFKDFGGKPDPLSVISNKEQRGNSNTPTLSEGLILGGTLVDDKIITFVGFEDVNKDHFFVPFSIGREKDRCCVYEMLIESESFVPGNKYSELTPEAFYEQLPKLIGNVIVVQGYVEPITINTTLHDIVELNKQIKISTRLYNFLEASKTTPYKSLPKLSIINSIPKKYSETEIPLQYLFFIKDSVLK